MNQLRQAREGRNLSQGQLAIKTGIQRQYISRLERGDIKNPSIKVAYKIATALNRNIDDIWIFDQR